jgi:pSer/pThr/pTyr-binding forkhead associated (FHA) protein
MQDMAGDHTQVHQAVGDDVLTDEHQASPGPREDAEPRVEAPPGRHLLVEDGADPTLVTLNQTLTRIGRGVATDVLIEDPTVSRRHAIVVQDDEGARVLDDRSTNGTFLNGERVRDAALTDGDVISIGRVAVRYVDRPA